MQPPRAWVLDVQQTGLSAIAAYYLWRGLTPTTRQNYNTPRSRFTLFCELSGYRHPNGACFPVKAAWLIEWLCTLAGTVKVKTMKLYLCGIKSYQLDLGIECTAFTDPRLELTLQGIKRDHQEPDRRQRSPLTRPYLLAILNKLGNTSYDDLVTRAAFSLAFAGFLRVGEFTYRKNDLDSRSTFRNWFLTKSSIRLIADGAHLELSLPASKTDPFRHRIKLTIAASQDAGCPVMAMKNLIQIDAHRPPHAPLFCIGRHQQLPFTREYVVQKLRELAIQCGLG